VVVQATFKYHGATDICKNWSLQDCRKNLEAILLSTATPTIVPLSEWGTLPLTTFGLPRGIQSATLETLNGTKWELKLQRGSAMLRLHQGNKVNQSITPIKSKHDRNKYTFVDLSNPVWLALGVTSPSTNTVKPGMSSKLRQCQKFVEIVDKLVSDFVTSSEERPKTNITVVDMGCGRGYLTFALHSYLYRHYREHISSRGIDVRPKLVKEISEIASCLGTEFERLRFEVGTIESFLAESPPEPKNSRSIEVVIALHACDTASDDALWSGIYRNSDVIVVAPCCHRELRHQLNQHVGGDEKYEHPYMDIFRHNIYRERMAETITDSMRALLLELAGYTVQVFEFIGGEHTSKNVMITAVKNQKLTNLKDATGDELHRNRLDRLQSLAKLHGIQQHKLASWIGAALSECVPYPPVNDSLQYRSRPTKMPPLPR
jgi:SAM-dependent methyltransferase